MKNTQKNNLPTDTLLSNIYKYYLLFFVNIFVIFCGKNDKKMVIYM